MHTIQTLCKYDIIQVAIHAFEYAEHSSHHIIRIPVLLRSQTNDYTSRPITKIMMMIIMATCLACCATCAHWKIAFVINTTITNYVYRFAIHQAYLLIEYEIRGHKFGNPPTVLSMHEIFVNSALTVSITALGFFPSVAELNALCILLAMLHIPYVSNSTALLAPGGPQAAQFLSNISYAIRPHSVPISRHTH